MINKILTACIVLFVYACTDVEFLIKKNDSNNQLENKVMLMFSSDTDERVTRELYSSFGNNEVYDFILKVVFFEKKENRIVKTNQVAEKIDYTLTTNYILFYKSLECEIFNKSLATKFSYTPKSSGYNYGSKISLDKLYLGSIKKNIQRFKNLAPFDTTCLK